MEFADALPVAFEAVAVYMVTPIDFMPDFLGAFGWVDDINLLGLALGRLLASAGPDLLLHHWDGNPAALGYLIEGVEEIGGSLPGKVRAGLHSIADDPSQMPRRRGLRGVRRIRVDEEAVAHTDAPGALFRMLEPFARNSISMTRIESRPSRRRKWDYVFFIDLEGHVEREPLATALAELKTQASLCRVLGSYPRAVL